MVTAYISAPKALIKIADAPIERHRDTAFGPAYYATHDHIITTYLDLFEYVHKVLIPFFAV
jgi:hypothetical protein